MIRITDRILWHHFLRGVEQSERAHTYSYPTREQIAAVQVYEYDRGTY